MDLLKEDVSCPGLGEETTCVTAFVLRRLNLGGLISGPRYA